MAFSARDIPMYVELSKEHGEGFADIVLGIAGIKAALNVLQCETLDKDSIVNALGKSTAYLLYGLSSEVGRSSEEILDAVNEMTDSIQEFMREHRNAH